MSAHDEIRNTFFHEAHDIIEQLDALLLELERSPSDKEVLNSIFRNLHTLKGSSGIFGFHSLEHLTHYQEDLMDSLRSEAISLTPDIIDLLFDSLDMTKQIFEGLKEGKDIEDNISEEIEEKIKRFLPYKEEVKTEKKAPVDKGIIGPFIEGVTDPEMKDVSEEIEKGSGVYQISLRLNSNCLNEGLDPLTFIKRLRYDGKVIGTRSEFDVPRLTELDPAILYFKDITFLYASKISYSDLADIFEFALESGDVFIHQFTPKELQDVFHVEVDSFWAESDSQNESWEETGTAGSTISIFIDEMLGMMPSVKKGLETLESSPDSRDAVENIFRFFHNITGNSGILGIPEISAIAGTFEESMEQYRSGEKIIGRDYLLELKDAALSLESILERMESEAHERSITGSYNSLKLENIPVGVGEAKKQDIKTLDFKGSTLGEILIKEGLISADKIEKALEIQEKSGYKAKTAIRIDAERLDNLVDLVGELVIAQSLVAQDESINSSSSAKLDKNLAHLSKITKNIQSHVMSMRMLPLANTFQKLARASRDISKKLGKEVNLKISGEDTEVDKTLIDEIGDPLIHMLRNAVDHGIETPEERVSSGKPRSGTIMLNAYHQGGNVVIEVKDDGKGLSREKIVRKALEKGLLTDASNLSDNDVYLLIFKPGFSTSDTITELSGRGVGLDIVKENIEKLRGKIDVVTEEGKGTAFNIRLPLTLAIIDSMIVNVGLETFVIPTLSVERSFRPKTNDINTIAGKGEVVSVLGNIYPIVRIGELFRIKDGATDPSEAILILVESEGIHCCLMVDNIIGHQQIVIKSLGEVFRELKGISGCTILGDGKVGLIVDISGIIKMVM